MRPPLAHLIALSALTLAACGGGGGGGEEEGLPPVGVVRMQSFDAPFLMPLCGTITNGGDNRIRLDIQSAGDRRDNTTRRTFYSFNLSGLPANAVVMSAVFSTMQYFVTGTPFAQLGNVIVDDVDVGDGLDETDYFTFGATFDIATLSDNSDTGMRTADITDAVRSDVESGALWTTLRLRFENQTDVLGDNDYAAFSPPTWTADSQRASLLISYYVP